MEEGTWKEQIPGVTTLAVELGVNHKTVELALKQLEKDGLLENQGPGRPRKIITCEHTKRSSSLRIGILLFDQSSLRFSNLSKIRQSLENEGHETIISPKTMCSLKHDPHRIAKMVERCSVDAWIVAGGSREILTWFTQQNLPTFALAGLFRELPIPAIAPNKVPAMHEALSQLVKNNHRRIIILTRQARRQPKPAHFEAEFLKGLEKHGITPSSYNLPNWEETAAGFHAGLESIFCLTPPTAIIVEGAEFIGGILQFCAQKGMTLPRDLSLFCTDPDPSFEWFKPSLSHINWNDDTFAQRVVRWASNVSHCKEDLKQTLITAKFCEGGTIGPACEKSQ